MKIKTNEVVFRKDLYPRIEHNQAKAQEYSQVIELLPAIEINQHRELIDGFHRWTAHKLAGVDEIEVTITETKSENEFIRLAITRNAAHGYQLSQDDKRSTAIRLYATSDRTAEAKKDLASLFSVAIRTVTSWVSDLDQAAREERRDKIKELYLRCYTAEEIAPQVGLEWRQVHNEVSAILEDMPKLQKVTFSEPDFSPPIYNVWAFGKKTNATEHFGNTEQRITDNLLWLYTQPLDIVLDPFGGGGSTLDVCRARGRRCYISDRKPKPGLEDKIRTLDICDQLPQLHKRWSEVSLTYLDPPYWRQAENQYSTDAEDMANMPLAEFTDKIVGVVRRIAEKQSKGISSFHLDTIPQSNPQILLPVEMAKWLFELHVNCGCESSAKIKSRNLI
jgi:hypothetical protein